MLGIVSSRPRSIYLKTTNWKNLISEPITVISQEHKILFRTNTISFSKVQSATSSEISSCSKFSICHIWYIFLIWNNLSLVVFILISYFFHYSFYFLLYSSYLKLITIFLLRLLSLCWRIKFDFGWPVPCHHLQGGLRFFSILKWFTYFFCIFEHALYLILPWAGTVSCLFFIFYQFLPRGSSKRGTMSYYFLFIF